MPATCYSAFNILNGFSEQQCTYSSGGRSVGVREGGGCVCACVSQCCLCCLRMKDGKNSACKPFANLHLCFHCDMMRYDAICMQWYAGKKLEQTLIFCFHDFHDIKLQQSATCNTVPSWRSGAGRAVGRSKSKARSLPVQPNQHSQGKTSTTQSIKLEA